MKDLSQVLQNPDTVDEVYHSGNFIMVKLTTRLSNKEYQAVAFAKCKQYSQSDRKEVIRLTEEAATIKTLLKSYNVNLRLPEHIRPRAKESITHHLRSRYLAISRRIRYILGQGDEFDIDRGIAIARGRAAADIMRQAGLPIKAVKKGRKKGRRSSTLSEWMTHKSTSHEETESNVPVRGTIEELPS